MDKHLQNIGWQIINKLDDIKRLIVDAVAHPKQKHNSSQTHSQQADQSDKEQVAITKSATPAHEVIEVQPAITSNRDSKGKYYERFPRLSQWEPVISLATLIVLSVYTMTTLFQWCAMLSSNKINRDALESVQQAFVVLQEIQTSNQTSPSGDKVIEFIPKWENTGATPAINIVTYFRAELIPATSLKTYAFMESSKENMEHGLLGPKSPQLSGRQELRESEVFETPKDKAAILWGWRAYRDIFIKTRPHVTEFCFAIDRNGPVVTPDNPTPDYTKPTMYRIELISCRVHNGADTQCPDYDRVAAYAELRQSVTP